MKILVLNGPNLNLLGLREPEIYGKQDYEALVRFIKEAAKECGVKADVLQSNHEGELLTWIQEAYGHYDGIVINPAAYTHTSIALLDALKAVQIPTVEVHISDVDSREEFRQISYVSLYAYKTIKGMGFDGYIEAVDSISDIITRAEDK